MADEMDNSIEFFRGADTALVTFSQGCFINQIRELAERFSEDVQILRVPEKNCGYLLARVPVRYIKIRPPMQMSQERRNRPGRIFATGTLMLPMAKARGFTLHLVKGIGCCQAGTQGAGTFSLRPVFLDAGPAILSPYFLWNRMTGIREEGKMEETKLKTVCFTGKRPKELFGYERGCYTELVDRLTQECIRLAGQGYGTFITGGAQGSDQLAFWAVDKAKRQGCKVCSTVFRPFENQENKWAKDGLFGQKEYWLMCRRADSVITCGGRLGPLEGMGAVVRCMNARNHAMVDAADLVFGICRGDPWNGGCTGGTVECLKYAKVKGRKIFLLDPFTLEVRYIG